MDQSSKQISLLAGTALVVGNMVGSGVFLLPATLAAFGNISLIGWICSSIGAILLAIVFGNLGKYTPQTVGGPYVYARKGFGDFAGFIVAWGYWISVWCTNAAIAVALVGYLEVFFPILKGNPLASIGGALAFIWLFSWINSKSVKTVAQVQLLTTILKVIPILLIAFIGIFYLNIDHFQSFNNSGTSTFSAITQTTLLTLFAFLGMESASIAGKNIKNPEKNIKRATIGGTAFTIFLYILSYVAIVGLIPADALAQSNAPFADAAELFMGSAAKYFVALGAIIATMGALNGWILIQGQIPMAAAEDKLFPPIFARKNKFGAPYLGIIFSSILASILMLFNFSKTLVDAYAFMITLSTLSVLVPYLLSSATLILFLRRDGKPLTHKNIIVSIGAFLFSIWIIIGCGLEVVMLGFLSLLIGVPVYFYQKNKLK